LAKEKSIIVIKKITIAGGGGHGGSWKVALADFMTAMMAFFLVMWLLNQTEETKKAVSDYFSTPSLIEYNFQNFGAEVTLEKLFLDLVNEPLKAFQSFMEPMDRTPDLLDMGSSKVVAAYVADQLMDYAKNVSVNPDGFDFDIPDSLLFERGTAKPLVSFVEILEKLKGVTTGLKDAEIKVVSALFLQAIPGANPQKANEVASERLDLVNKKIQASLEHTSTNVVGMINVVDRKGEIDPSKLIGFIKVSIRQKEQTDGKPRRKLDAAFGAPKTDMNVYDNFVHQLTTSKGKNPAKGKPNSKPSQDPNLLKDVDSEVKEGLPSRTE
jgi:chemotaxis protein MotB